MKYRCTKEMWIQRCDGDGVDIPNEYEHVANGSIWERDDRTRFASGGVHLDLLDDDPDVDWIEITFEDLRENFVLIER